MLDPTTADGRPYMKYTLSRFYYIAFNLCPNLHAGDLYCSICERVTEALEQTYQAGVSYGYWKQKENSKNEK